jgi:hypothetical protein
MYGEAMGSGDTETFFLICSSMQFGGAVHWPCASSYGTLLYHTAMKQMFPNIA